MRASGNAFYVGVNEPHQFASSVIAYRQLRNDAGALRKDVASAFYTHAPETIRRPVGSNIDAYIFGSVSVAG